MSVGSGSARRANIDQLGAKRFQMTHTKRVLLAEDNTVVAADLVWELEALGITVVEIVRSLEEALEWINGGKTYFALLNVFLKGRVSYPAARQLKSFGIPYAFFTGLEKAEIEPEFSDIPHLSKPQSSKAVAKSVNDLLRALAPMPAASAIKLKRPSLLEVGSGHAGQLRQSRSDAHIQLLGHRKNPALSLRVLPDQG